MTKEVHCPECGCEISGDYMSADKARRYFFAALRDTHANLPDHLRERWPNAEALRKQALIAVGHCDTATIVVGSKAAAPAVAGHLRSLAPNSVAIVKGDVIIHSTARSMARRVLLKKEFLKVAEQVFAWIAEQTGINPAHSHDARAA